jgi:surface antigen
MKRQRKILFLFSLVLQLATPNTTFPCGGNYGDEIGDFQGTTAYSNGEIKNCTGTGSGKYQCVEYVKRFYKMANIRWGNAKDIISNAPRLGLTAFYQGGVEPPKPGDILCFGGGRYGHVAIIRTVEEEHVTLIEQNWHNVPGYYRQLRLRYSNGYYIDSGSNKIYVQGWLRSSSTAVDNDNDGYNENDDCDDSNPNVHPNAQEHCNGIDDDCDGQIDENFSLGETCTVGTGECRRTGVTVCTTDGQNVRCNVDPGTPRDEICGDNLDNDCDGEVDEEGTVSCPGPEMISFACICIDRYEASRPGATATWSGWPGYGIPDNGTPHSVPGVLPWQMVTWGGAVAACLRAGKRLCRASEWKKICQSNDSRTYPYGNLYEPLACNGWEDSVSGLSPTGSFDRCSTPEGVFDLSGNVWEWIENDLSPTTEMGRLGGSFVNDSNNLLLSCIASPFLVTDPDCASEAVEIDPVTGWPLCSNVSDNIGFRCCWP